jgi:hypothetical protein
VFQVAELRRVDYRFDDHDVNDVNDHHDREGLRCRDDCGSSPR